MAVGIFFFDGGYRGVVRALTALQGRNVGLLRLLAAAPGHTHVMDLADDRHPVIETPSVRE